MHTNNNNENGEGYFLIIEDCADQRNFLCHTLRKNKYNVRAAKNGKEALEIIKNNKPKLIFSDINLPEMNGYEFCEAIKKDSALNDIPIILITANWDMKSFMQGLESGADYYFLKPFDRNYLINQIEKITNRKLSDIKENDNDFITIGLDGKFFVLPSKPGQILRQLLSLFEASVDLREKFLNTQLKTIKTDKVDSESYKTS